MFTSLESFSAFFFVSFAIILLGILFEEKLVAVEIRMHKKSQIKKRAAANASRINRSCSKAAPRPAAKACKTQGRGFAA